MAVSFPGFPWRFSRGASKEKQPVVKGASLNSGNSSSDWGAETVKFQTKISGNGKWQGSEERRVIDKEFDVVVVPSDEPLGPGFHGDEDDGGYAVLVPCYKCGYKELVNGPSNQLPSAIKEPAKWVFVWEVLGYYEVGIYDSEKMDQQSLMQTVQMTIIAAIMAPFFLPTLLFHLEQSLVVSGNNSCSTLVLIQKKPEFCIYLLLKIYLDILGSMPTDNTANIVNHNSQLNVSANSFLWNGMKLWTYNFISLAPLNSIVQFFLMTCEPEGSNSLHQWFSSRRNY
ncbi:hypothetical protein ES319_D11G056500v1 [Gossypium barbadense]|uniref:Uncharacterized protein n=1 Tax=Gossypium barbadense TaxID=3634 RepID=A0A5J5P6M8_GOSBA|nr:hypothetical protein ES319_D11G056500v1 [Gossypium barbadense]